MNLADLTVYHFLNFDFQKYVYIFSFFLACFNLIGFVLISW